jgi:hypothetical protein
MMQQIEMIRQAVEGLRAKHLLALSSYGLTICDSAAYEQFGLWSIPVLVSQSEKTPREVFNYLDLLQEQIAAAAGVPISLYIEIGNRPPQIPPAGVYPPVRQPPGIPPAGVFPQ